MQGFRAEEMGNVEGGGGVVGWVCRGWWSRGRDWEGRSGAGGVLVESEQLGKE